MNEPHPLRLSELAWNQVVEHLRRDPRLIFPIGTLLQHGPHLPLGTDTLIATRIAEELSIRHRVLVAPTLPYGAGAERDQEYAGTACLRGKTLHGVLNELVTRWERNGVEEFVLLTTHGHGAHLQAMATVICETARLRSVDLHAIDLSDFLESHQGGEHAGELATSLVLHLAPHLVRRDRIEDADLPVEMIRRLRAGEEPVAPPGSVGVVGHPSRGSGEKGREIFEHLVTHIGERLLSGRATRV